MKVSDNAWDLNQTGSRGNIPTQHIHCFLRSCSPENSELPPAFKGETCSYKSRLFDQSNKSISHLFLLPGTVRPRPLLCMTMKVKAIWFYGHPNWEITGSRGVLRNMQILWNNELPYSSRNSLPSSLRIPFPGECAKISFHLRVSDALMASALTHSTPSSLLPFLLR